MGFVFAQLIRICRCILLREKWLLWLRKLFSLFTIKKRCQTMFTQFFPNTKYVSLDTKCVSFDTVRISHVRSRYLRIRSTTIIQEFLPLSFPFVVERVLVGAAVCGFQGARAAGGVQGSSAGGGPGFGGRDRHRLVAAPRDVRLQGGSGEQPAILRGPPRRCKL